MVCRIGVIIMKQRIYEKPSMELIRLWGNYDIVTVSNTGVESDGNQVPGENYNPDMFG